MFQTTDQTNLDLLKRTHTHTNTTYFSTEPQMLNLTNKHTHCQHFYFFLDKAKYHMVSLVGSSPIVAPRG